MAITRLLCWVRQKWKHQIYYLTWRKYRLKTSPEGQTGAQRFSKGEVKTGGAWLLIKKKLNFPCVRNKQQTLFSAVFTRQKAPACRKLFYVGRFTKFATFFSAAFASPFCTERRVSLSALSCSITELAENFHLILFDVAAKSAPQSISLKINNCIKQLYFNNYKRLAYALR